MRAEELEGDSRSAVHCTRRDPTDLERINDEPFDTLVERVRERKQQNDNLEKTRTRRRSQVMCSRTAAGRGWACHQNNQDAVHGLVLALFDDVVLAADQAVLARFISGGRRDLELVKAAYVIKIVAARETPYNNMTQAQKSGRKTGGGACAPIVKNLDNVSRGALDNQFVRLDVRRPRPTAIT